MASKINQPTGFIKLTNVAFIKYKVDKEKFEIACYKNKAINWRNGVEKDLNEVLQSEEIYVNATHGTIAKKEQLQKAFPKMSKDDIIKMILEKGELQVSENERKVQIENMEKDIINFVQEKVVHPESQRQFSQDQITQAIQDIHFNIKLDIPTKRQSLICIQKLQEKYYITRAKMRISVTCEGKHKEKIEFLFQDLGIKDTKLSEQEGSLQYVFNIDPNVYRPLIDGLKQKKISVTNEVLVNNIVNKEVQDISNAGTVELKIREEWLEQQQKLEEIENQKQKEESQKTMNKKKKKKQHQKLLKEQQQKEEEEEMEKLRQQQMKFQQLDHSQINQQLIKEKQIQQIQQKEQQKEQKPGQKKCTYCKDAFFDDASEFRQHFKSEWHVINVKRKTQQKEPFSFQDFQIAQLDEQFQ